MLQSYTAILKNVRCSQSSRRVLHVASLLHEILVWSLLDDSSFNMDLISGFVKFIFPFHGAASYSHAPFCIALNLGVPSNTHLVPEISTNGLPVANTFLRGCKGFHFGSPPHLIRRKRIGIGAVFKIRMNVSGEAPVHMFCIVVTPKYIAAVKFFRLCCEQLVCYR
jgi:hypothetical protein